ncbi:glycolate oxidase iron-sulfur subunit [Desulfonatronum thiosulfatophilum]|uniref:Glycolate oxidase iron-sulfur subunit n=1 Tax=Desulfonatronum thiosulfatophilum TaxID=617002 RepID=A0A1G6EIQ8_9BACT|nr:(Fe-S)-binding protein [Desulfonatronum thiosulfatophilum]SDB57321.1 glycolate oxidase iron-sulfur subunit [Desulfonatronum thiosulfatophilum]
MADIKKLVSMLKELDDLLTGCMRCGMCQAQCPVFAQTGRETDVTRGKLALLSGLSDEILKDPVAVNEKLQRCLLCGTCEANCPSGVKVTDIFLRARAILSGYLGLPPAQRLIFRRLLTNPKLMNNLLSLGASMQSIFTKEADGVIGTSCARFNAPLIADRHFKKLAAKPFHTLVPRQDTPPGKPGLRVAFFPGCVTDKVFPQVGEAVLKIMKHHDIGVYMPPNQACCGIPALSSGEPESFDKLVRQNLDLFAKSKWDYLITPCATCTATIAELWPKYYGDKMDTVRVQELAAKVMDVSQFLTDVLKITPVQASAESAKVAYHDPCHLRNTLKVTAQPRNVLTAGGKYVTAELPGGPSCCGSGGSFNIKHYKLSDVIGRKKAESIAATGAKIAATSCPACMLQLADMLSKTGHSIPVKHVAELYAETL